MPRIRSIKPEFFKHWELYKAEKESGLPIRLAYEGLWTVADKEGRFRYVPQQLKLDVLPYDEVDFEKVFAVLVHNGWVISYQVDGKQYACIPTFKDHQRITGSEATSESKIPAPPEPTNHSTTLETPRKQQGNTLEIDKDHDSSQHDCQNVANYDANDSLSVGNTLETLRKQQGNTLDDRRGKEEEGNIGKEERNTSPPTADFFEKFFDVEKELLADRIRFEAICMHTERTENVALESLRKYHLHLQEKESYPMPKKALYAGFEKWLRNEKKFTNGTSQVNAAGGAKLGTSEARTGGLERW